MGKVRKQNQHHPDAMRGETRPACTASSTTSPTDGVLKDSKVEAERLMNLQASIYATEAVVVDKDEDSSTYRGPSTTHLRKNGEETA
jgi:hypothetical protein